MAKDLGTYHARVVLDDGRGFIMEVDTGLRYTLGGSGCHPLTSMPILPSYENEDDVAANMEMMFSDGNYSCDCNLSLFLARANQEDEPDEPKCGDTLVIKSLTLIRPDGSERPLETLTDMCVRSRSAFC